MLIFVFNFNSKIYWFACFKSQVLQIQTTIFPQSNNSTEKFNIKSIAF